MVNLTPHVCLGLNYALSFMWMAGTEMNGSHVCIQRQNLTLIKFLVNTVLYGELQCLPIKTAMFESLGGWFLVLSEHKSPSYKLDVCIEAFINMSVHANWRLGSENQTLNIWAGLHHQRTVMGSAAVEHGITILCIPHPKWRQCSHPQTVRF